MIATTTKVLEQLRIVTAAVESLAERGIDDVSVQVGYRPSITFHRLDDFQSAFAGRVAQKRTNSYGDTLSLTDGGIVYTHTDFQSSPPPAESTVTL